VAATDGYSAHPAMRVVDFLRIVIVFDFNVKALQVEPFQNLFIVIVIVVIVVIVTRGIIIVVSGFLDCGLRDQLQLSGELGG
jgi:hypothetical protein